MFESAVRAAVDAARAWSPDAPDLAGGLGCCGLCLTRYRVLVLNGPLQDLPHHVAHAAIIEVDAVIRRTRSGGPEAVGGLLLVALEELGAATGRLTELRHRHIEPAIERYLASTRGDEFPTPPVDQLPFP